MRGWRYETATPQIPPPLDHRSPSPAALQAQSERAATGAGVPDPVATERIGMSDWKFLEANRVRVASRSIPPEYCSTETDGFNGMFRFVISGKAIRCIASDGMGWRHVSVSIEYESRTPSWDIMCQVKGLFWNEDEIAIQFHPKKSEYVNFHEGCLHLWQPFLGGKPQPFPTPLPIMVGPKGII